MSRSAALTKRFRDWPALMKPTTARDYLDGVAANKFATVVAPHLEARFVGGELRYTRKSIRELPSEGRGREFESRRVRHMRYLTV